MKNTLLYGGTLITGLTLGGITGCASEKEQQSRLQSQAHITREQAQQTALGRVPGGIVKEGEIEKEKGRLIWSFDIAVSGSANITEVAVDAMTGAIVAVETETPEEQKKEKD